MPVGALTAIGTGLAADALGTAALASLPGWLGAAGILETGLVGAGIGAGSSAIFGRDPGKGAITGGLGGLAFGAAPALGSALDISPGAANILLGAGTGAGGAALTGGDPGRGALTGGIAGGVQGLLSGGFENGLLGSGGAPAGGRAAAPSAASPGAAAALAQGGPIDLTAAGGATPTLGIGGAPIGGDIPEITVSAPALGPTPPLTAPALTAGALAAGTGGTRPITSASLDTGGLSTGTIPGITNPGAGTSLGSGGSLSLGGSNTGGALDSGTKLGTGSITAPGGAAPTNRNFGADLTKTLTSPSTLLSLGALGLESSMQPKLPSPSATVGTLQTQADKLNTTGTELASYLLKGGLPPGVQESISRATRSAKATLRSQYASMGLTGSTAEASALAGIDQAAAQQTFDIANNLLQSGLKMTGMSDDLYKLILETATAENQHMGSAISNFASAIASTGRPQAPAAA